MKNFIQNRWVWLAARLLLGGLFMLTSIAKMSDIPYFIDEVIGYGLLPIGLARLLGSVLPWVELFIGCALILGVFVRLMSVAILPLSVVFGIAGIYAIVYDSGIRCGCFGSLIPLTHQQSLAIDCAMLVLSLVLVTQKGKDFLILERWLDRIKPDLRARGKLWFNVSLVAIVVLLMAVVTAIIFGLK